jgi:hypothetical protein
MEKLTRRQIKTLLSVLKSKNYVIYDKPYQLNIVGRRTNNTKPNSFDDWMYVFFKNNDGDWEGYKAKITTDAGTYWLLNPSQSKGTALLKEGQYVDTYKIDKHRAKYYALTQRLKPVVVIRDYNRDSVLDFNNGNEDKGMFGINIHKASSKGTQKFIDKYSAGCQVFENADDFDDFMDMAYKHKDLYGNVFTYTLIDQRAYQRGRLKRIVVGSSIGLGILALSIGIYVVIKKNRK